MWTLPRHLYIPFGSLFSEDPAGKWKAAMVLQIHDELLFETPRKEAARLGSMVREKMEGVMDLSVPVVVDLGQGPTWDDAH